MQAAFRRKSAPYRTPMRGRPDRAAAAPGRVRIIGGRWRGSKLDVPDAAGLRPTADRVRETLFNWLQPHLHGAACLDLFAGSGALGFEAASRGAGSCVLVERDPGLATALRGHATRLGATQVDTVTADALAWLAAPPTRRFDIVFIDPPFAAGLHDAVFERLHPWLAPDAWIYIEAPREAALAIPHDWQPHRDGSTRDVRYALHHRRSDAPATLRRSPQTPSPTSSA